MDILTKVRHDGILYDAEIGVAEHIFLGFEDHGIFTATVNFKFNGAGQSIPMYALDSWDDEKNTRVGSGAGMEFIKNLLRVFGVSDWESIRGVSVYVLRKESRFDLIVGLAHPVTNEVFIFKDVFQ